MLKFISQFNAERKISTPSNKNIIRRNVQSIQNASARIHVYNKTINESLFSKAALKNKLGNANSKVAMTQKALALVNDG
jgi:hypothetical protein